MLFNRPSPNLVERLANLENHLKDEHPDLVQVLPTYRKLDKALYRLGLLANDESLATRITWWPLISVLGTFSSGKSTFINHTLTQKLQKTGNQAVDDKFTVICYSHHDNSRTLPGTALNNDPRFPFFRIGAEIEKVAAGEGRMIDTYLQLKTANAEHIRGRTLIDSPGFDADDQRRSTLRLTDHIIDISDLVLIFFDARHPEPGAMQDTLAHLVSKAASRADRTKFVYILNQIDTTAREDNPEEVVAAWQRALAQSGLASGRFLCIYNEDAAVPIESPTLRERYRRKRDEDMAEITRRMDEVEVERGYRIVSALEDAARGIEGSAIPELDKALDRWRKMVGMGDVAGAVLAVVAAVLTVQAIGWGEIMAFFDSLNGLVISKIALAAAAGVVALSWHYTMRNLMARRVADTLTQKFGAYELNLKTAFLKNTSMWRSAYKGSIAGWSKGTQALVKEVLSNVETHIQRLNDQHTDPSGRKAKELAAAPAEAEAKATQLAADQADRPLVSQEQAATAAPAGG
ncbi:MAG: dynamin family protein [Alphaproteobacteria bacterium]|nr:dynamin family protein [Alphaproteobacteria bacterium]